MFNLNETEIQRDRSDVRGERRFASICVAFRDMSDADELCVVPLVLHCLVMSVISWLASSTSAGSSCFVLCGGNTTNLSLNTPGNHAVGCVYGSRLRPVRPGRNDRCMGLQPGLLKHEG